MRNLSVPDPLQEPFHHLVHWRRRINTDMRIGVGCLAAQIELLHLQIGSEASGRRPSAGMRSMTRLSGRSSHATRSIVQH